MTKIKTSLKNTLRRLPDLPGVYKMISEDGVIIYVGKAKSLKKRVKSYFSSTTKSTKTEKMVSNIDAIDFVVVNTELEAIMLETNLIKQLKPKYNILMKDDKNFAYIKIHLQEDFPRISITRKVTADGAKYFGPTTSAYTAKEKLKVLKKLFPYRHCGLDIKIQKTEPLHVQVKGSFKYPCLDYHIKRCSGPCINKGTQAQYMSNIKQIIAFLGGDNTEVKQILEQQMRTAASNHNFETAAKIRDKIGLITTLDEKQNITSVSQESMDVVNFTSNNHGHFFAVFQVRRGKIINECNHRIKFEGESLEPPVVMMNFLQSFYQEIVDVPTKIIVPVMPHDEDIFTDAFEEITGVKVNLAISQKGKKNNLLELALKNAIVFADRFQPRFSLEKEDKTHAVLLELQKALDLKHTPRRMECYDISHLAGNCTVASMVVFIDGKPMSSHYRHFNIKSLDKGKIDDFASMYEVLLRRLAYIAPHSLPEDTKIRKLTAAQVAKKMSWLPAVNAACKEMMIYVIKKGKDEVGRLTVAKIKKETEAIVKIDVNQDDQDILLSWYLHKSKARKIYWVTSEDTIPLTAQYGFRHLHNIPTSMEIFMHKTKNIVMLDKNTKSTDVSFSKKPDLIVIDGGKGQLSSAVKARDELQVNVPIISLAKKQEEIFIPGRKDPIHIDASDEKSYLIQRIRNEAHRFAIEHNRVQRKKKMLASSLDSIKGIGKTKRQLLLRNFGSISGIQAASLHDLSQVIGEKAALTLKSALEKKS